MYTGVYLCVWITHPGFEGYQFEYHLHSEDGSEDHIQDVHNIIEQLGLTVVLGTEMYDIKLQKMFMWKANSLDKHFYTPCVFLFYIYTHITYRTDMH